MRTIVVFSGGLDSTTLLYHLRAQGHEVRLCSVRYGQRHHTQELAAAERIAAELQLPWQVLDLTGLAACFAGNALTESDRILPAGPYKPHSMTLTTVPNRNMVLLAIALSLAIQHQADAVAFGAHGGAYTPYADCQPEFAAAMDQAAQYCHRPGLRVLAPFIDWEKADIVRRGAALGVPWGWTYSCYAGGPKHCGRCGTCQDRALAFRRAGIPDPTAYETDPTTLASPPEPDPGAR